MLRMAALPDTSSTRDRLLAAAVDVFVEQGYEGARVQDIARGAGLTTGAIYANFRGQGRVALRRDRRPRGCRDGRDARGALASVSARQLLELLGDRLVEPRDANPAVDRRGRRGAPRRRTRERVARPARPAGAASSPTWSSEPSGRAPSTPHVDTDAFARFCLTLAMGSLVMRTLRCRAA